MKQVIRILINDLRRRLRNPVAVLLMMLIPLVLTLIIGVVFGRSGDVGLPRIKVLIVNMDGGIVSDFLMQGMRQEQIAEMIDLVEVEEEEGRQMMEKGKASALIEIPEGFSEDVLDQRPTSLAIVKNPSEAFLPAIVEEVVLTMALVLSSGSRIFSEPIGVARSLLERDRWPSGNEVQRLLDSGRDRITLTQGYLTDSLITLREDTVSEGTQSGGFNLFAYVMPGSLLIGLLFICEIALRDIFREKKSGTLGRLFAAPVEAGHITAAKILSTFIITAISCMILLIIGRFAFGISMGDPVTLAVHFIGTILMCTGIITLFYGFIRSERAADAIMSVVIIVLCMLGGSMISYDQMGRGMQQIARFSPVFWAIDGFKKSFMEGAGMGDLMPNFIVLYGVAVVTVLPGTVMLRRKIARGG